jgi:hypothetical protein
MDGKHATRFELHTGNLVLTRNTSGAANGSAAVYFGIGVDRNPQDVLELADASIEWVFEVVEEGTSCLRIRFEVPSGMTVLRAEILERNHPESGRAIQKMCATRTPLYCFAQKQLIQRVLLRKSSMQKMIQQQDLLWVYSQTEFLPLVRMNFWKEELRGQERLVVTVMSMKGTAMFGKTPLLDSPFID